MEEQRRTGEDESPPSINLGLGIGGPTSCCSSNSFEFDHGRLKRDSCVSDCGRTVKVEVDGDDQMVEMRGTLRNRECSVVCFTEEQLEELKSHILIFKYMVSGLPVPLQLLLPIWRNFSPSFAPSFYRRTTLLGFFQLGIDQFMDPEPGRCRRTDGKKWRCHKSVVPNEKYCENHMHRGRKRSRKLVEPSSEGASQNSRTLYPINANRNNDLNNDLRIRFPANLDCKPHSPSYNNPMSNCSSVRGNIESKDTPTRFVIRAPSLTNSTAKINENSEQNNVGKHGNIMNERIAAINLSSGLDFSPKSVLHDDLKEESRRCRRTDGKKWRCGNEVFADQKYCVHHMNRGSKKPALALSTSGKAKSIYDLVPSVKFNRPEWVKMGLGLDTKLNFTLNSSAADPRHSIEDDSVGGSGGSGSSSETTVTE